LVQNLVSQVAQLPNEFRGDRVYIETQLLPNYLAPSHFPSALLAEVGAFAVGSRAAPDVYRTPRREQKVVTRRLILALEDAGLKRFERSNSLFSGLGLVVPRNSRSPIYGSWTTSECGRPTRLL